MSLIDAISASGIAMDAESLRLNTVASNLANSETTSGTEKNAYHAKMPVFQTMMINNRTGSESVRVKKIVSDKDPVKRLYDPGNPQADKDGYVFGTNVNRIEQLTDMISASQSYKADAEVANTCKEMMMNVVSMMKE